MSTNQSPNIQSTSSHSTNSPSTDDQISHNPDTCQNPDCTLALCVKVRTLSRERRRLLSEVCKLKGSLDRANSEIVRLTGELRKKEELAKRERAVDESWEKSHERR
jgi:predicted mannosyl-3-phosphoglycerate phosphatase (HAD superfamily)